MNQNKAYGQAKAVEMPRFQPRCSGHTNRYERQGDAMLRRLCLGSAITLPLFFILPASASDWVQVNVPTENLKRADVYIDLDNVKVQGQRREFWQKLVFYAEKQNSYQKKYFQSLSLKTVDCAADTWGVTLEVQYDRQGLIVSSYTSPLEMDPATASIDKAVNGIVCR